jgi:GNAT superfamily N-acetyltransferase
MYGNALVTETMPRVSPAVSIAVESFDIFWHDGQELFAEHEAETGVRLQDIDIDLVRLLDKMGMALFLVARSAGQMVGYITYIIGPSLEKKGERLAEQKPFFVRKGYRGFGAIGPKLHARAKEILRDRGVNHILMRAGTRGVGDRQRVLFEREGAVYMGDLYYLTLEP